MLQMDEKQRVSYKLSVSLVDFSLDQKGQEGEAYGRTTTGLCRVNYLKTQGVSMRINIKSVQEFSGAS